MAHPQRRGFVEELLEQLGDVEVVWDRRGDRWDTGRRALLAHSGEWGLTIQDDAIPCQDFLAGAEKALTAAGERPVAFYTGQPRPWRSVIGPAIARARREGSAWLEMEGPWWGVALAIPTSHIPDLIAWCDKRTEIENYDRRISRFYHHLGIQCWYSVPSLVEHRSVDESPSLIAGRTGNRRAYWFHPGSALEIDWETPPVTTGKQPRGVPVPQNEIADRRIYGYDRRGRRVLVATPGKPIPEGFRIDAPPEARDVREPSAQKPKAAKATTGRSAGAKKPSRSRRKAK